MKNRWIVLVLLLSGIVNGFPLIGVLSGATLERLYGLTIADPNLLILMRHRAVLFGLLGALLFAAIFVRSWRGAAITAGLVSMLSFCALAWLQGEHNPAITRLFWIDLVMSIGLASAGVLHCSIHQAPLNRPAHPETPAPPR